MVQVVGVHPRVWRPPLPAVDIPVLSSGHVYARAGLNASWGMPFSFFFFQTLSKFFITHGLVDVDPEIAEVRRAGNGRGDLIFFL